MVKLLSARAGGVGLNITGASRVVMVEPAWNPAIDSQSIARSWRIGQTRPVFVYRFFLSGSIEEVMLQRQLLKKDIDIPETILDWLLEAHPEKTAEEWETEFLAAVDQMSEWAFHDACTGCNPVYPTIAELKGCYLKAIYGEKKYAEKYGDIWEVPVTLPTDTHAPDPMGLCADLGVEKTGGFN